MAPPKALFLAPADCESVLAAKHILVVGAGGIGCELLKNLVIAGFRNITVIDLDTIDISNLNRQFLFHKKHVGMPKSKVAAETVMEFCPDATVTHIHDSVLSPKYGCDFVHKFDLVLNALDNRAARIHMNRLCLATGRPLVESGSAGYLGQVSVIRKGLSECYECTPKATQRTYPGCTIRNTPSEPIHCIVWAKHLFNQLFGECDIDEDVAPDLADPELQKEKHEQNGNGHKEDAQNGDTKQANGNTQHNGAHKDNQDKQQQKVGTRAWAEMHKYDPKVLFDKLFHSDIVYLLSMEALWKSRQPPTPLVWEELSDQNATGSACEKKDQIKDQSQWTPLECRQTFAKAVQSLSAQLHTQNILSWDKDDETAMDFVAAVANLRSLAFGIALKTRFDIKSMAGNIIPAIASTNAIVAGLIVVEATKLMLDAHECSKTVFISRQPNPRGKILVDQIPDKPNKDCYSCAEKVEIRVQLNCATFTQKKLEENLLKKALGMVAPDVSVNDVNGSIIVSSEKGDTDGLANKTLSELRIAHGCRLTCDDYLQVMELQLIIEHSDEPLKDNAEFLILTEDLSALHDQKEKETAQEEKPAETDKMDSSNTQVIGALKRKLVEDVEENGDAVEVLTKKAHFDNDGVECID